MPLIKYTHPAIAFRMEKERFHLLHVTGGHLAARGKILFFAAGKAGCQLFRKCKSRIHVVIWSGISSSIQTDTIKVTGHSSEVITGGKGGRWPVRTYSRRADTRVAMGL